MIPELRKKYNSEFTPEKYQAFLSELNGMYPGDLDFRIAESPLFIPKDFTDKMLSACESILDVVDTPAYRQASERAVPAALRVPNDDAHPHFIAFDFGICMNEEKTLEPQLIEMQGFPSLFALQAALPGVYEKHFDLPGGYDACLNGLTNKDYKELMRKIIVGEADPENVILLEIFPGKQKTRVDFRATEDLLDVRTVCLTELISEGRSLFYMKDGKKTKIERIYNRLIFDDLFQQPDEIREKGKILQQDLDVTWIPHPNWFYRYSKFSLPFINHQYVPGTHFLNEMEKLPEDLENYVVKPLFSFAGQGVIIDVTKADIDDIKDPENWIIQKKVNYAAVIETPDERAKAEIRLFYFWEPGAARPIAVNNLARISKGKMVGVRYNMDKEWVGGSLCLFEK